jgi:curved DNA-binding protein CbpA
MKVDFSKDYYNILEIDKGSNATSIKQAYHRLALKYHPDKNMFENKEENAQRIIDINEAYSVLKDEKTRNEYDKNYVDLGLRTYIDVINDDISIDELNKRLEDGFDINTSNQNKQTILMYAANRGKTALVSFLLGKNASINIIDDDGNSPFICAAAEQNIDFSVNLIKSSQQQRFTLEEEILTHKEKIKAAIREIEEEIDKEEENPTNNQAALKESLKRLHEIESEDPRIKLHEAENDRRKLYETKRDGEGFLEKEKAIVAKMLADNGAEVLHVNNFGDDALVHAKRNHNNLIIDLLSEYTETSGKGSALDNDYVEL